jgi:hypothetical protein
MFGPWEPQISSAERLARCRALRALAGVFAHRHPEFAAALMQAEAGDQGALRQARELLDRLPALNRRRLLASYAEHVALRRRSRSPAEREL